MEKRKIIVQGSEVRLAKKDNIDFICLTDIVKAGDADPHDTIKNYLRNKGNINFLGVWESVHSEQFNIEGFNNIKFKTGDNNFTLSVSQWIKETNAVGVFTERGKYGGTYAHEEIAIQFSTWFSAEFYVYFIKAFKQLAELEDKSTHFFLDKIFNNSLENNRIAAELLNKKIKKAK